MRSSDPVAEAVTLKEKVEVQLYSLLSICHVVEKKETKMVGKK